MHLYYITDRRQFPGDAQEQHQRVLAKIAECAAAGVDYIQLREKDLTPRALHRLAEEAKARIPADSPTRLLINSRVDVAIACGAHGVHLPANSMRAADARSIFAMAGRRDAIVAVSTHSVEEVAEARAQGVDFVVFGPVFEKNTRGAPDGLQRLQAACRIAIPVFALGGVTRVNAPPCLAAGATGVAGIRLFQDYAFLHSPEL
ncbi:MAG TPA: thiamine phosphate synthase [Candidatus Saccharimonadales bacterium]|nr:thiamine phosphate synthase [Candidatus Saccharimonadales bacterium]